MRLDLMQGFFFMVGFRKGVVAYESRLMRFWLMQVIGSLGAM